MADTNITQEHREAFEALTSGDYANFALFSCFVNGEPASAIVAHRFRLQPSAVIQWYQKKKLRRQSICPIP